MTPRGFAVSSSYAVSLVSDGREHEHRPPPRRTCAQPGCRAILSIYNEGTRCALHAPAEIVDEGPRYEPCAACGRVLRASRYFAVKGKDAKGRTVYATTCKVCEAKTSKPATVRKLNAIQREQVRIRERLGQLSLDGKWSRVGA